MEFIDTIIGAGIAWLAFRAGTRHERKRKTEAVCGCEHHRSFHEDGTGKCHYSGWDFCNCQQYRGPQTLDDLIPED